MCGTRRTHVLRSVCLLLAWLIHAVVCVSSAAASSSRVRPPEGGGYSRVQVVVVNDSIVGSGPISPKHARQGPNKPLIIVDTKHHCLRLLSVDSGSQSILAGQCGQRGYQDGDPGTVALFDSPHGVDMDPLGNLIVADSGNNAVRIVMLNRSYGVGDDVVRVFTLAGHPTPGKENGDWWHARFSSPTDVLFDPVMCQVLVLDAGNHMLRGIKLSHNQSHLHDVDGALLRACASNKVKSNDKCESSWRLVTLAVCITCALSVFSTLASMVAYVRLTKWASEGHAQVDHQGAAMIGESVANPGTYDEWGDMEELEADDCYKPLLGQSEDTWSV